MIASRMIKGDTRSEPEHCISVSVGDHLTAHSCMHGVGCTGQENSRIRLRMRPVEERTELLFLLADAAGDHLPGRSVPEEQTAYLDGAAVGHCDAAVG